jgi:hypothetical protein
MPDSGKAEFGMFRFCLKLRQFLPFCASMYAFRTRRALKNRGELARWRGSKRDFFSRSKRLRHSVNVVRHGTAIALFGGRRRDADMEQLMSTFDTPFDPDRSLRAGGCRCGLHVSEAEHEAATQLQLQAVVESEQKRYEGVVASAVMRRMFP